MKTTTTPHTVAVCLCSKAEQHTEHDSLLTVVDENVLIHRMSFRFFLGHVAVPARTPPAHGEINIDAFFQSSDRE